MPHLVAGVAVPLASAPGGASPDRQPAEHRADVDPALRELMRHVAAVRVADPTLSAG
jgi:hypothetical protein